MAVIKRVITALKKQLGRRLRVTADRGFADVDLAQLVMKITSTDKGLIAITSL